jgi:hypothetical protein
VPSLAALVAAFSAPLRLEISANLSPEISGPAWSGICMCGGHFGSSAAHCSSRMSNPARDYACD